MSFLVPRHRLRCLLLLWAPGSPVEAWQAPGLALWGFLFSLGKIELCPPLSVRGPRRHRVVSGAPRRFSQAPSGTPSPMTSLPRWAPVLAHQRVLCPSRNELLLFTGAPTTPDRAGNPEGSQENLVYGDDLECGLRTFNHVDICPEGALPKCTAARSRLGTS